MDNEITPPGTARPLRIPPGKSVPDKQKTVPTPQKKAEPEKKKNPNDDDQIHIDEYI